MSGGIHTKLHEALAACPPGEERDCLLSMAKLPHYVFDINLMQELDHSAVIKSLEALQQAGVLAIPFPEMFVELWDGYAHWRRFVRLVQLDTHGTFETVVAEWIYDPLDPSYRGVARGIFGCRMTWSATPDPDTPGMNMNGEFIEDEPGAGFRAEYTHQDRTDIVPHLGRMLMIAIMMTHLNGLTVERVETAKLNKARARNGKPAIPDHTVVRIGHVYDSAGRKVSITGSGHKMPIHMRAAHVRPQHHGAPWLAANPRETWKPGTTEDSHLVLIEAVLVNYREGTDLEKPLPKLVKY